jgi:cytochrome c biogenesis factor
MNMGSSWLETLDLSRWVDGFGPVAFPVPPSSSGACLGGVPPQIGLEALALPTSRLLMAVGHDYCQKVKIHLPISHGGVCIFMLGVLLSNTNKIQFTQRLPLGSELHMGKERCCLRGLDHLHGPTFHSICGNLMISKPSTTSERLTFEHDEELRADLLPIHFPASYENGKLEHFLHRWMKNHEHQNFWLTMFPERRYFFSIRETRSTTEVAIHTNPFTDLYAPIGTGSSRTGGWYTTIMKLPFIFSIRIGFLLASSGGSRSLLRQLQKEKLHWNRESSVLFIIA